MKKLEKVLLIVVIGIVVCVALFFIVLLIIALCQEDNTEAAKKEFSKYYNGKDEVVGICSMDELHFENRYIDLLQIDEKISFNTILFANEKMFYATKSQEKIEIYSCDYYGNEKNLVYTKNLNNQSFIMGRASGNTLYLKYKENKIAYIDTYNAITGEYKNIASGKGIVLADYIPEEESIYDYSIIENKSSKKRGFFKIKNTVTNQEKIIDENFLSKTEYIESLNMFKYSPDRVDISNGHILLTYSVGVSPWHYTQLIFEYDFEEETLEYKCLIFPDEVGPALDILYIGM